jgi:hypothetical protein
LRLKIHTYNIIFKNEREENLRETLQLVWISVKESKDRTINHP